MDAIDRQIIAALQQNGRTTNAELARLSNLAASSTLERVRRLEERGVIRGYRALLEPQALGLHVQALVLINLDRHQAGPIGEFEDRIRAVPGVKACYHITGRYDYMLHLIARDIDHLRELVTHTIGSVRGVEKQETFLVLSMPREDVGCPLDVLPDADTGRKQEA